jgi:hypothetical protein
MLKENKKLKGRKEEKRRERKRKAHIFNWFLEVKNSSSYVHNRARPCAFQAWAVRTFLPSCGQIFFFFFSSFLSILDVHLQSKLKTKQLNAWVASHEALF